MATVKAEVLIRGTIELPATKETDEEMDRVVEQAKKYPIDTLDDVEVEDIELYKAVSYTHLTLPTTLSTCRSRWSPYD